MVSVFGVAQCGQVMIDFKDHIYFLEHVTDVRSSGRISEDCRFQVVDREVMADGDGKQIDHLVGVRANEMRAKNLTAVLVDQRLIAIDGLANPPCRIPVGHLGGVHAQAWRLPAGRRLRKANRCNRRQGKGNARYAAIVGPMSIAFQDVGGNPHGWRQASVAAL